jgi:hypothetical protein
MIGMQQRARFSGQPDTARGMPQRRIRWGGNKEIVWKVYGTPMEYVWNFYGATRLQSASTAGAGRGQRGIGADATQGVHHGGVLEGSGTKE